MTHETQVKTKGLRARRLELGLTLEAFAERAHCSLSYLSRIERGLVTDIHYGVAVGIAEVLGIPIEEIPRLIELGRLEGQSAHAEHDATEGGSR